MESDRRYLGSEWVCRSCGEKEDLDLDASCMGINKCNRCGGTPLCISKYESDEEYAKRKSHVVGES